MENKVNLNNMTQEQIDDLDIEKLLNEETPIDFGDPEEYVDDSTETENQEVSDETTTEAKEAKAAKESKEVEVKDTVKETNAAKEAKAETKEFDIDGMKFDETEVVKLAKQAVNQSNTKSIDLTDKQILELIKSNNIDLDSLNSLVDITKGKKEAIKYLKKKAKIEDDELDSLDENDSYKPTNYAKDLQVIEYQETLDMLNKDKEFPITKDALLSFDKDSQKVILSNAKYIVELHQDIKSGIYDQIAPTARKKWILDGRIKPFIDYYVKFAGELETNSTKGSTIKENEAIRQNRTLEADNADKVSKQKAALPKANTNINNDDFNVDISDSELEKRINASLSRYKKLSSIIR